MAKWPSEAKTAAGASGKGQSSKDSLHFDRGCSGAEPLQHMRCADPAPLTLQKPEVESRRVDEYVFSGLLLPVHGKPSRASGLKQVCKHSFHLRASLTQPILIATFLHPSSVGVYRLLRFLLVFPFASARLGRINHVNPLALHNCLIWNGFQKEAAPRCPVPVLRYG